MLNTSSFLVLFDKRGFFESLNFLLRLCSPLFCVLSSEFRGLVEDNVAFVFNFLKNFVLVEQVLYIAQVDSVFIALKVLANEKVGIVEGTVLHVSKLNDLGFISDFFFIGWLSALGLLQLHTLRVDVGQNAAHFFEVTVCDHAVCLVQDQYVHQGQRIKQICFTLVIH